jgi:hypothetical protein
MVASWHLDVYPNAEFITEAFIQQSGINLLTQGSIEDETLIESSYLTFPTQSRRVIWQSDINDIFTAEVDGSFKRRVQTRLAIYSLQGFVFSPLGNFVAYYFGAYASLYAGLPRAWTAHLSAPCWTIIPLKHRPWTDK